jgi:acetoin utilization deacetylase AcuC-like enzyme
MKLPTTCFAYDPIEQIHTLPGHVENSRRTAAIMALLEERGLLESMSGLPVPFDASEDLYRVHSHGYVKAVSLLDEKGGGWLDADTYVVPGSYRAALASAGAAIEVTRAVTSGQARNGISIMRPPGHHALPDRGMGFCLFANAAVAARFAQAEMGLERVLIIDWDVHHGNGTEAIFYDDPSVAYASFHQYPFYPGTGAATDTGIGPGRGYTLNIPFPAGVDDAGYQRAFDDLVVPFARRVQPQLIIVSSGYDAHWRDPLAQMGLSVTGYVDLTRRARELAEDLCDGRLVVLLEGGYDLDALSYGVMGTVLALMGREAEAEDPFGPAQPPAIDASSRIQEIKHQHRL